MIHALSLKQIIKRGVLLGLIAFALNFSVGLLFKDLMLAPGHLFVFLSAITLGITGVFYTLATSVIPESIIQADGLLAVRLAILTFSIAAISRFRAKLPICIVATVLWVLVFALCSIILTTGITPLEWIKLAMGEIFFLSVCNFIILNPNLVLRLDAHPRPVSQSQLLVQGCCATFLAGGSIIVSLLLLRPKLIGIEILTKNFTYLSVYTVVTLLVTVSLIAACLINYIVSNAADSCEDLPQQNLLKSGASDNFTGLHSDYWRRRNSSIDAEQENADYFSGHPNKSALIERQSTPQNNNPCQMVITKEGQIHTISEAFEDVLQAKSAELLGKKLGELKNDQPLVQELLLGLEASTKNKHSVREIRISSKDSSRFFEMAIDREQKRPGGNNPVGSIIISLNEITKKRVLSPAMLKHQKLHVLGLVCPNVVNTVLNLLETNGTEGKKDKNRPNDQKDSQPAANLMTASNYAREFLDFAAMEIRGKKLIDLRSLIAGQIKLLQTMIGKDYPVNYSSKEASLTVYSDPSLLRQMFTNLLLKARKSYLDSPGEISVTLDTERISDGVTELIPEARAGVFARIRVKDNGCGMTPEKLKKVFDPEGAVKDSSTDALLLASVYAIVREHDGFLSTESAVNKGTNITVYLPLTTDEKEVSL